MRHNNWVGGLPSAEIRPHMGPCGFAFQVRVKALHHWIRKGDAAKSAERARECAHLIHYMERKGLVRLAQGTEQTRWQ